MSRWPYTVRVYGPSGLLAETDHRHRTSAELEMLFALHRTSCVYVVLLDHGAAKRTITWAGKRDPRRYRDGRDGRPYMRGRPRADD